MTKHIYQTDDIEERNVTNAMRELFAANALFGVGGDPIELVCKTLLENISDLQFAFYCYLGEETGRLAAIRKGVQIFMPPPDVQRKVLDMLWKATEGRKIAVMEPEESLELLTPAQRKKWKVHRGVAMPILEDGRPIAIMTVYVKPEFKLTDRHRAWLALFGEIASLMVARRKLLAQATVRCADDAKVLSDRKLDAWVNAGLRDTRIKVVAGLRGSNKLEILKAVRKRVLASGVPASRVVYIALEDAKFRSFKTADDVLDYLAAFPTSEKVNYLFLDEVAMLNWHSKLICRLQGDAHWNVWLATSSHHAVCPACEKKCFDNLLVYRAWPDSSRARSETELIGNWCQVFMRDVVSGVDHPDLRAKEALAEYYSDHLCEAKSLREISKEMKGRRLSIATIRAYRQALVDAYLIEFSKVYDVFANEEVSGVSERVFYTDLELRAWRFGGAREKELARMALNRFYLDLRRRYDVVYTPNDGKSDFVTMESNGEIKRWSLSKDTPSLSTDDFPWGGGGISKKGM